MKKILLLIVIILIVGCSNNGKKGTYQKIDNNGLNQVFESAENYKIIDVRTLPEYNSEHIENAINIPVDGITIDTMRDIDVNDIIIVYCKSGSRSKQAALKLIELGYINVYDFGAIDNYDGRIIE